MENMLPGNSFPQICVVSVNKSVGYASFAQGHERALACSNRKSLLISKRLGRRRARADRRKQSTADPLLAVPNLRLIQARWHR